MMNQPSLSDSATLVGDLSSFPSRDRRLWNEDVFALDQLIEMDPSGPYSSTFREIISHRMQMLDAELSQRVLLTELLQLQVHHQLRAASDFQKGGFVVEQWVPALRCWLVSGRFEEDTPAHEVIRQLKWGDPRNHTPEAIIADTRIRAAQTRTALDKAGDDKVLAAVDALSTKQLEEFVAAEQALQTGETICAHGPDAQFIERGIETTKKAAARGDIEAQRTLLNGKLTDTALCINPGDNPNVRKDR